MFALQREPESRHRWHVLLAGGTLGCAVFGATLGWAARLPPVTREARPQVIRMQVIERLVPEVVNEPPKPQEPNEPEPRPEPAKRTPPQDKQALPTPPKLTTPPPKPQDPVPESQPPEPLALGLTLSSTTENSRGPKFAVGDSLMGEPDRVAKTPRPPRRVHSSPPSERSGTNPSRAASSAGKGTSTSKLSVTARLKRAVQPAYPASAKNLGLEGVVVLSITIDANGRVEKAQVLEGLGGGLDEAAINAARRSVWQPATLDGKAVSSTRRFNVRFTLTG